MSVSECGCVDECSVECKCVCVVSEQLSEYVCECMSVCECV